MKITFPPVDNVVLTDEQIMDAHIEGRKLMDSVVIATKNAKHSKLVFGGYRPNGDGRKEWPGA